MKTYRSFGALARALERAAAELPLTYAAAMRAGGESVKNDAQERIGHYQAGWDLLQPATVAQKIRMEIAPGGDGGDNPLLRTGDMRDSIAAESTDAGFVVGSAADVLAYQEIGTSRIPPRPVLAPALKHMAPFITTVLGRAVEKTLAGDQS